MADKKAAWGTYSKIFWTFYNSTEQKLIKKFPETKDAARAQRAMLNLMNREKIFNVIIERRENVVRLEKDRIKHEAEGERFRNQIMRKFLEKN